MTGELTHHESGSTGESEELPDGAARTLSGRISAAADLGEEQSQRLPFSSGQLGRLDEALTLVSRHTQLRFSIYLGELDGDSRVAAEKLHDELGDTGIDSVLIAVDPGRRSVDIVTGSEARIRLSDRDCELAIVGMVASFKEGDLIGGLLSGLRALSDHAGQPR